MGYIKTLPLPPPRCRSVPHQLPPASAVCRLTIDSKKFWRYDRRFQDAKEEILKNLKWIDAKGFLEKCVIGISQEDDQKQRNIFIRKYIDTHLSFQLRKWNLSSLRAEKIDLIYFRLFSCLLKASLYLLQKEIFNKMTSLLEKALQKETVNNSEG